VRHDPQQTKGEEIDPAFREVREKNGEKELVQGR